MQSPFVHGPGSPRRRAWRGAWVAFAILFFAIPLAARAYVGPGAGFVFVSSFLTLFASFALAFGALITWPIRWAIQQWRWRKVAQRARARRVIVLGLDGQDPALTEDFMNQGLLPNFSRLKTEGTFSTLATTLLAESPVAWSSFQTGCNPGKHAIYDFLTPNRKSYLPELSSARITGPARVLKLGKYRIPLGGARIHAGRKSVPFWKLLGDHGVFSAILRVPITFPAEKFKGVILSAMCVPDLKGSQGTYYYFSSDAQEKLKLTSGVRIPFQMNGSIGKAELPGPDNSMVEGGGEMKFPFEVRIAEAGDAAELRLDGKKFGLRVGEYTPWIPVDFRPGLGMKVRGICRFLLIEARPHLKLYVTPINIDPGTPALPISYPSTYAVYLAKSFGPFATLGVAEDTSALNEGVIGDDAFLAQCQDIHKEREIQYFDALSKITRGAVVCVFDITDRLQHMFYRYIDPGHPALPTTDTPEKYKNTIRDLYVQMDGLVGRTLEGMREGDVLFVISDHGFKPFRRGVNLNSWLHRNGYLVLEPGGKCEDMLQGVDWSKSRAYAMGFGGIFLNLSGREAKGTVKPGAEADALKQEIREKLLALVDEEKGDEKPLREVYDAAQVYRGPYSGEAPDLIAGFRLGYRVSWSCVTGGLSEKVIEDNTRPWSGDHNFNPPDVPGMLFSNKKISAASPRIIDMAPTVLDLFGVPIPAWCDGRPLMPAEGTAK